MTDVFDTKMDPVFETMGLLYVSYNLDEIKKEIKQTLSDIGFDGEQFYLKYFKTYEKYVQAFSKKRTEHCESDFFFGEKDSDYFLVLLSLIVENRNWLNTLKDYSKEQINAQIIHTYSIVFDDEDSDYEPESLDDIIMYLNKSGLSADAKWKMLCIMQEPKKYMGNLAEIINSNVDAYNSAINTVAGQLGKLLNKYDSIVADNTDKRFTEMKEAVSKTSVVYPSLIFPVSQIILEKSCYYGLLCDKVVENGKFHSDVMDNLLLKLKALSDSSKLGILCSLKVCPKYNLEIANQLGLTAATMSHHMNVLLNSGLVGVEKRDGRVYYHLKRESLQKLIEDLEETLL